MFWKFLCLELSFLPTYGGDRLLLTTRTAPHQVSLRCSVCNCCVVLWLFCFEISDQRLNIIWLRAVHLRDIKFIFRDPRIGTEYYCLMLRICIQMTHNSLDVFIHLVGHVLIPGSFLFELRILEHFCFLCVLRIFHPFLLLLPLTHRENLWMFTYYPSVISGLSICFVFHCL